MVWLEVFRCSLGVDRLFRRSVQCSLVSVRFHIHFHDDDLGRDDAVDLRFFAFGSLFVSTFACFGSVRRQSLLMRCSWRFDFRFGWFDNDGCSSCRRGSSIRCFVSMDDDNVCSIRRRCCRCNAFCSIRSIAARSSSNVSTRRR